MKEHETKFLVSQTFFFIKKSKEKMLFGHRQLDKTRPHNLFADWSQRIKKENKRGLQRTCNGWKKQKHTANMKTEIFM